MGRWKVFTPYVTTTHSPQPQRKPAKTDRFINDNCCGHTEVHESVAYVMQVFGFEEKSSDGNDQLLQWPALPPESLSAHASLVIANSLFKKDTTLFGSSNARGSFQRSDPHVMPN